MDPVCLSYVEAPRFFENDGNWDDLAFATSNTKALFAKLCFLAPGLVISGDYVSFRTWSTKQGSQGGHPGAFNKY
jgi:hypothetical protein